MNFIFPVFLQDCALSTGTSFPGEAEGWEPADLGYAGVLAKPGAGV